MDVIWRLRCSGGVAEGCHLPWVGVADEDFPGHAPGGIPLPVSSFFVLLIVVGERWPLPLILF